VGNKQAWHVLSKYPSGSKFPNKTGEFKPKARASALNPGPLSGLAEVLARESSADEVNGLKVCSGKLSDVSIAFHSRPAGLQELCAIFVDLNLPSNLKTGPLQAKL